MTDASRVSLLDRRQMLGGLAAAVGAASPTALRAGEDPPAPGSIEDIEVAARPITQFERGGRDVTRFGPLEFRGGLVLSSPSSHFGGWSGLVMAPDGSRLFAVSDVGSWMTAGVAYTGTRPSRLTRARIGPLLDA